MHCCILLLEKLWFFESTSRVIAMLLNGVDGNGSKYYEKLKRPAFIFFASLFQTKWMKGWF